MRSLARSFAFVGLLALVAGCGQSCLSLTTFVLPSGFRVSALGDAMRIEAPLDSMDRTFVGYLFRCEDSEEICYTITDLREGLLMAGRYRGTVFPEELNVRTEPTADGVEFRCNLPDEVVQDMGQTIVALNCRATRGPAASEE